LIGYIEKIHYFRYTVITGKPVLENYCIKRYTEKNLFYVPIFIYKGIGFSLLLSMFTLTETKRTDTDRHEQDHQNILSNDGRSVQSVLVR
jgi:hypothetical protein